MSLRPNLKSYFGCKRPGMKKSAMEYLRDGARKFEGLDEQITARLFSVPGQRETALQRLSEFARGIKLGVYTPEMLARDYPVFAKMFDMIAPRSEQFKRFSQKYHHSVMEELGEKGIKVGDLRDERLARFLNFFATHHLIDMGGEVRPMSNSTLRATLERAASGDEAAIRTLLPRDIRDLLTTDNLRVFQDEYHFVRGISDGDIDMARKIATSYRFSWEYNREEMRKVLKRSISDPEDIKKALNDAFGEDVDGYFPHIRNTLRSNFSDFEAGSILGGDFHTSVGEDLRAIDRLYGTNLDVGFTDELKRLAGLRDILKRGGQRPTGTFTFLNAEKNLGIKEIDYAFTKEGMDRAIADLFNLRDISGKQNDLHIHANSVLDALAKNPNKNLVAMMAHIPAEMRVRFYKQRMLGGGPWTASVVQAFPTYMNATLKYGLVQPLLDEIGTLVRETAEHDPTLAKAAIMFFNDVIGNPHRAPKAVMQEMGKFMSFSYAATLGANFPPALANWFGQTGFIIAEQGYLATFSAMRALGSKKSPLNEFLDEALVGLESRPLLSASTQASGSPFRNLTHGFERMRRAESVGEALRIAAHEGLAAADIFSVSESQMRRLAYAAGITKFMMEHPNAALRWGRLESGETAARKFTQALRAEGGRDAIAHAGEMAAAKGAFLFGNVNNPEFIRGIRALPTGLGQAATMFSNFPIQATSKLIDWTRDASRVVKYGWHDPAAKAGIAKLTRFFTFGVAVAGPFFIAPILRDMVTEGDQENASKLKNFFVEWEKRYSVAGLAGQAAKALTGEYNTVDLAGAITIGPASAMEPLGPLSSLGSGPLIQLLTNIPGAVAGTAKDLIPGGGVATPEEIKSREQFVGGWVEHKLFSGLGDPSKPFPMIPASTMIPNGVAIMRFLNSVATLAQGARFDETGRLVQPASISREVVRQLGRPLDEVLASTENRAASELDKARDQRVMRLKRALLDGNTAAIGDLLTEDTSLLESIEPNDIKRLFRESRLVPSARAAMRAPLSSRRRQLVRSARRLSSGNLTPAEEFEDKQKLAVLSLQFMQEARRRKRP